MDPRKLDTGDVLSMGILNKPAPTTDIPKDRERVSATGGADFLYIGAGAVEEAVNAGKVVHASNYYGLPYLWRDEAGRYQGRLLQYRSVTESPSFDDVHEAAAWFSDRYHETDG